MVRGQAHLHPTGAMGARDVGPGVMVPSSKLDLALQPCSTDDKAFILRVTEEAMRVYVEQTYGSWDASEQRSRLDQLFDPSTYRLILVDGVQAGLLVVEDRPSEIF